MFTTSKHRGLSRCAKFPRQSFPILKRTIIPQGRPQPSRTKPRDRASESTQTTSSASASTTCSLPSRRSLGAQTQAPAITKARSGHQSKHTPAAACPQSTAARLSAARHPPRARRRPSPPPLLARRGAPRRGGVGVGRASRTSVWRRWRTPPRAPSPRCHRPAPAGRHEPARAVRSSSPPPLARTLARSLANNSEIPRPSSETPAPHPFSPRPAARRIVPGGSTVVTLRGWKGGVWNEGRGWRWVGVEGEGGRGVLGRCGTWQ